MNHILSALPRADARWLLPRLKPVQLKARDELETSNQPVKRVFFIETGIAAVVSNSGKARIALGLIGCEGSSAVAVMLGDTRSPHSTVMLNDGTALSLPKSAHSMLWLPVVICWDHLWSGSPGRPLTTRAGASSHAKRPSIFPANRLAH
jgi:hypothetical protein